MWKFFLIITLITTNLYAQSGQDDFQKQMDEIMKAREEMLRALMNNSMSGSLEKRMEDLMKRFDTQGDFGFGGMEAEVIGEYDWVESKTHRILKIKVKQVKDKPLDIKIQNNEIKVKGDVESTQGQGKQKITKKTNFERTFSIPKDVDQKNPEFGNGSDGFMEIRFKKLVTSKEGKPKTEDREPVTPNSDDLSI